MTLRMENNRIGVELLKKSKNKETFLNIPEAVDNLGTVRFVFSGCKYEVGQKVYYGGKRERIRMAGVDVEVMEPDNIIAIVEE